MVDIIVKESIIPKPTSPVTTSWDNPFPTFPSSRPKPRKSEDKALVNSLAEMNIRKVGREPETRDRHSTKTRSQDLEKIKAEQAPRKRQYYDPRSNGNAFETSQHDKIETLRSIPMLAQYPPSSLDSGVAYDSRLIAHGKDNGRAQHQADQVHPASTAPPSTSNIPFGSESKRSMTMPNDFTEGNSQPQLHQRYPTGTGWQEGRTNGHYYAVESQTTIPQRPSTSNDSRAPANAHLWLDDTARGSDHGAESGVAIGEGRFHAREESLGDFLDTYYDTKPQGPSTLVNASEYRLSMEEEMPNFDAMPMDRPAHYPDMTIEQHLQLAERPPNVHWKPFHDSDSRNAYHDSSLVRQAPSTGSKPDDGGRSQLHAGDQVGVVFELPGDVPVAPPMPSHVSNRAQHNDRNFDANTNVHYDNQAVQRTHRRPWPAVQNYTGAEGEGDRPHDGRQHQLQDQRKLFSNPQLEVSVPQKNHEQRTRGLGSSMSPINRPVLVHPPVTPSGNPDALPEHPTPVRPGLMPGSAANQTPKPPPIRQYNNNTSAIQQSGPTPQAVAARAPQESRASALITMEELERLKQTAKGNPKDQKTQLILAKKFVQAASVLADEGGRADPRTRNKNREKYILDAHKIIKKLVSSGYPDAMFYLADCHGRGLLGLETDNKEAFTLYQSAAKAGHAQSAYRVAVCCEMGHEEGGGTRRDPLKAIQWYKRAAMLGDTPAMYKMGMILLKGLLGLPKNPREAIVWLKRAADRADEGNPHALHELVAIPSPAYASDG